MRYTLRAEGYATTATSAMYGPNPYIAKVTGIFAGMESMVGKDFEKGLAQLKAAAEEQGPPPPAGLISGCAGMPKPS